MSNVRFENSSVLTLLIFVPVLWFAARLLVKAHSEKIKTRFGDRLYPFLSSSLSSSKRNLRLFMAFLALSLLILANARVQWGSKLQEIKSQGVEMMVLFDVSDSMLCQDVAPSRLEFAKRELSRLLDLLPGSRVGLVAFAGVAALTSPITTDSSALKMFIEGLSPSSVSRQGTDFSKALAQAEQAFKHGGVSQEDPTQKATRVILIFSDGEDNEPGAMEAAEKLTKQGIRIFTVAFGSEKGGPIPYRDRSGNLQGYIKDKSGQMVISSVHGDVLRELAEKGRGSFFFASTGSDYLKNLYEDINKLEKSEFESKLSLQYEEQYQWILGLAILVAVLELLMTDRRAQFKIWRGRFEVPPA